MSTPSPLFQGGTPGANTDVYKPYVIEPINSLQSSDLSLNIDWQISANVSLLSVSSVRKYDNSFAEATDGRRSRRSSCCSTWITSSGARS